MSKLNTLLNFLQNHLKSRPTAQQNVTWSGFISLALYFVLVILIALNITLVLELPSLLAVVLPLGFLLMVGIWYLTARTYAALLSCLFAVSMLSLIAVAIALAVPAWQVIFDSGSSSWAGRMAPLFVSALALHASNLWIATVNSGARADPIERLAGLFYGPSILTTLVTGLILCAATTLGLELLAQSSVQSQSITKRFLERGVIPPLTVWLFCWGGLLLLGKWWNGWYLARLLRRWQNAGDLPSPFRSGLDALRTPKTLAQNMQILWQRHEESWLLPRYISWAVPILGFIGTVLGISLAADGIRRIIGSDAGFASLSSDLDNAIAPLGIAFDTTLIALSLSLILTLALVLVQRNEERILALVEKTMREHSRDNSR